MLRQIIRQTNLQAAWAKAPCALAVTALLCISLPPLSGDTIAAAGASLEASLRNLSGRLRDAAPEAARAPPVTLGVRN